MRRNLSVIPRALAAAALLAAPAGAGVPALDFDQQDFSVPAILEGMHAERSSRPLRSAPPESADPRYFMVDEDSIVVEELGPWAGKKGPVALPEPPASNPPPRTLPSAPDTVDYRQVVNIAERVWTIIEKNKPSLTAGNHFATAVPLGTEHWTQLESWGQPETTSYRVTAKNGLGMKVVEMTYVILRSAGGRMKGRGRYLTGVSVLPVAVEVSWGYKLTLDVVIPSVTNRGSEEDPLAAMTLNLTWTIDTPMRMLRGAGVYYLQGDGFFQELASPFHDMSKSAGPEAKLMNGPMVGRSCWLRGAEENQCVYDCRDGSVARRPVAAGHESRGAEACPRGILLDDMEQASRTARVP